MSERVLIPFWRTARRDGEPIVYATCPSCQTEAELNHDVDSAGNVDPSLECPTEGNYIHESLNGERQFLSLCSTRNGELDRSFSPCLALMLHG